MRSYYDSTGNPIQVGDSVKFRGKQYTIKEFGVTGKTAEEIYFIESQKGHTEEVADEWSVDLIPR